MFYAHYNSPPGFNYRKDSFRDMKYKSKKFVHLMKARATAYRTKHIMVPFGGDFEFQDADSYFKHIEELIRIVNRDYKNEMELIYSCPKYYLDTIKS